METTETTKTTEMTEMTEMNEMENVPNESTQSTESTKLEDESNVPNESTQSTQSTESTKLDESNVPTEPDMPHPSVLFGANEMSKAKFVDSNAFQVSCAILTDSKNRKTLLEQYNEYKKEVETLSTKENDETEKSRLKFLRNELTKPQYVEALFLDPASRSLKTETGTISLEKVAWEIFNLRQKHFGKPYVTRGIEQYPFKPPRIQNDEGEMVYDYVNGFHVPRAMFQFYLGEVNWVKLVLKLRQSVIDCARRFYEPSLKDDVKSWTCENARYSVKNGKFLEWKTDDEFKEFMTGLLRCVNKVNRLSLNMKEVYDVTSKIKAENDKNRLLFKKTQEETRLEQYKMQKELKALNDAKVSKTVLNPKTKSSLKPFKAMPKGTNQWKKPLEGVSVPSTNNDNDNNDNNDNDNDNDNHNGNDNKKETNRDFTQKTFEKKTNKYEQKQNKKYVKQERKYQRDNKYSNKDYHENKDNNDNYNDNDNGNDNDNNDNNNDDGNDNDNDDGGKFQPVMRKKRTQYKSYRRNTNTEHVPVMRR